MRRWLPVDGRAATRVALLALDARRARLRADVGARRARRRRRDQRAAALRLGPLALDARGRRRRSCAAATRITLADQRRRPGRRPGARRAALRARGLDAAARLRRGSAPGGGADRDRRRRAVDARAAAADAEAPREPRASSVCSSSRSCFGAAIGLVQVGGADDRRPVGLGLARRPAARRVRARQRRRARSGSGAATGGDLCSSATCSRCSRSGCCSRRSGSRRAPATLAHAARASPASPSARRPSRCFESLDVLAPGGGAEAFTWVTTAEAAGWAAGSAVAGLLVDPRRRRGRRSCSPR